MRKNTVLGMHNPLRFLLLFLSSAVYAVTVDHSITGRIRESWQTAASRSLGEGKGVVEYGLVGEGYHRELVATLRREGREGEGAKDYIIAINVTSNFYIDLDQISQMAAFGGPDVIASGDIDTERHAVEADSHFVLVYATSETVVKLPLHIRYQGTGSTPYSATIIPAPLLLSMVSEGASTVSLPCSPSSPSSLCHWHPSPLTPSHPTLVATVPVGQTSHTIPVVTATIALTFGSMFYLMHTIHMKINIYKTL